MKDLKNLNGAKVLSKSEQKLVIGGKKTYACQCDDGSAVWEGSYSSDAVAASRADYWCGGGGTCY